MDAWVLATNRATAPTAELATATASSASPACLHDDDDDDETVEAKAHVVAFHSRLAPLPSFFPIALTCVM